MKRIPLRTRKGEFYALVDDEDFERLNAYVWELATSGSGVHYAARRLHLGRRHQRAMMMHREIIGTPDGMLTDHINHNTLDNRRCNLRVCTHRQNAWNTGPRGKTSRFKGVSRGTHRTKPWQVRIRNGERRIFVGAFLTEEEAGEAYRLAALHYHGEFANV